MRSLVLLAPALLLACSQPAVEAKGRSADGSMAPSGARCAVHGEQLTLTEVDIATACR